DDAGLLGIDAHAEVVASEADHRDLQAGIAEISIFHLLLLFGAESEFPNEVLFCLAKTEPGIHLRRAVEIHAGMLRADLDVAKGNLQFARRIDRMRSRYGEHSRDRAPAQLDAVGRIPSRPHAQ